MVRVYLPDTRTKISLGARITWTSAAGVLTGIVKNIEIDLNAAQKMIPWMTVTKIRNLTENTESSDLMLCATDDYMKMMKMEFTNA
jgi:hypothetical protein